MGLFTKAGKAIAGEAADYFDELMPLFKDVKPAKAAARSKAKVKSDADLEAQMRAFKGKPQSTIGTMGGVSTKTTPGGLDISRAQALDEAPDWANPDQLEAPVVRTYPNDEYENMVEDVAEQVRNVGMEHDLSPEGLELVLKFDGNYELAQIIEAAEASPNFDASDLQFIEASFREYSDLAKKMDSDNFTMSFAEFMEDVADATPTSEKSVTRYDRFGDEIGEK